MLKKDLDLYCKRYAARNSLRAFEFVFRQKVMGAEAHLKNKEMARFISSFKAWQYTTRCTIYNNLRNVRLFRVKQFFNLWRKNEKFPVTKKIKVIFSDDVVFYEKGLKTKAMVCLFRQHLLGIKAKNFFVKTTLVKFFTQNWLSAMRKK